LGQSDDAKRNFLTTSTRELQWIFIWIFPEFSHNSLTHPMKRFPNNPPGQIPDAIHEASLIVIGPELSGVSSDFKIGMLAEGQPHVAPYENASKSRQITAKYCRFTLAFSIPPSFVSSGVSCKNSDLTDAINCQH
jgi:hypothetical protein